MKSLSYGLIGFPLGHSISGAVHACLFSISGIDANYRLYQTDRDELEGDKSFLHSLDGFNVTIPHKRNIIPMLSKISKRAERCGAVNTVKREGSELFGYNTDAEGFIRALNAENISLSGNVLLCGTGGAARMMACEALERGCVLTFADRKPEKAETAKNDFEKIFENASIKTADLNKVGGSYDLILNATPCGMYPKVNFSPVSKEVIENSGAVFDAVGNPCETLLVKTAKEAGLPSSGGLKMLIYQAVAAHEIWNASVYKDSDIAVLYRNMYNLTETQFKRY